MEVELVTGYYVFATTSERTADRVKGPFSNQLIAMQECEGAGWYGSLGEIQTCLFLKDPSGNLYEYDPDKPVRFVDLDRDAEREMMSRIKSKLSENEMKFLNNKMKQS